MKLNVEDQYNTLEALTKDVDSKSHSIATLKQELSKIEEELQQASLSHQENLSKHTNSLRLIEADVAKAQAEKSGLNAEVETKQVLLILVEADSLL